MRDEDEMRTYLIFIHCFTFSIMDRLSGVLSIDISTINVVQKCS